MRSGRHGQAAVSADLSPSHRLWTGRLEFELSTGGAWAIATVDVSIRMDIASFFIGARTLAVADRDSLRQWLHHPHEPYYIDNLEFTLLGSDLCVRVDGSLPYVIPADIVQRLVTSL